MSVSTNDRGYHAGETMDTQAVSQATAPDTGGWAGGDRRRGAVATAGRPPAGAAAR
jgi:hypothetical protein